MWSCVEAVRQEVTRTMQFGLQDEMASRVTLATPRTPEYRTMSLLAQFYSKPKYLFKISRSAFFPVPGVDSAMVHFELLPEADRPHVASPTQFWTLVKAAFSQRRKTLRNSLKPLYSAEAVVAALDSLGLPLTVRAEELTLTDFVSLFSALQHGQQQQGQAVPQQ